jgi:hypothetical protein
MANASTLTGTQISTSEAEDASLCRVSGYLYDIHGNAIKSQTITIRHIHAPMVYGSTITVLNERQSVRTDSDGLLQFDTFRKGKIKIELPGRVLDLVRVCTIPDESSVSLVGILFPYIVSVTVSDDPSAVSISVGEEYTFTCVATLSNGEELDVSAATTLASSDEDVVTFSGAKATGVGAGTATITLDSVDTDSLEIYQEPDGDVIERLSEDDISFEGVVTVTVS